MGYVIALAGKGGTGKTTIAALIVRLLKEKNAGSILAIDADPNSNLGESLGMAQAKSIGQILDEISVHPEKIPSGMPKDRFIEYQIQTAIAEGDGFDVLTMGRPEGPGCYCYINNSLRNVMSKLINDYKYIIIDNEAGLEHLSRRTTRAADSLLVISDSSKAGLRSAKRIDELARELQIKIKKRLLIINCTEIRLKIEGANDLGLEHIGNLPLDDNITKISLNGNSLWVLENNSAGIEALRKIGDKIWQ